MIDDKGLQDEVKKVNSIPLHPCSFGSSNSKRFVNNFIHAINWFYTKDVYCTDTDTPYLETKHWDKLHQAGLIGKGLLQDKNDYKDGGVFCRLFLASKIK